MSLLQELKRRNVIKVALAYIVVAWLVAQVLQLVFESFGTPDWVMKTVLVLMAVGLVFALFFAWAFELTPEGLKREREVDRSESITPHTGKKLNHLIMFLMVLAIFYFTYDKFVLRESVQAVPKQASTEDPLVSPGQAPEGVTSKSVAVLPFVDMSPDNDQEYFTDGLTENLLNALAQLSELKVAGRTSSFAFKNRNEDLRSIAGALGVAHVLEGSVQKSGERIRITAQLINADDGFHLWSETYDRTLDDIFAVQDEIANEVAKVMQVKLLGRPIVNEAEQRQSHSGSAFNDYLKGLHEQHQDSMEGHERAIAYFRRALDDDPQLALAWAGLSLSTAYITGFTDNDFSAGFEEARTAAMRALEIEPDLPEAWIAMADVQSSYDWDWAATRNSLEKALALRPGDSEVLLLLADLQFILGNVDDAVKKYQQVAEQDPLNLVAQRSLMMTNILLGQFDDASQILQKLKAADPNARSVHWGSGLLWIHQGNYQRALEAFSQERFEFLKLTGQAIAYHHLQQTEQANAVLQTLISTMGESSSYQIAQVYAQWGETENALGWLDRAYKIRDPGLQFMNTDPFLDPIRETPRFQALLEKMNFK